MSIAATAATKLLTARICDSALGARSARLDVFDHVRRAEERPLRGLARLDRWRNRAKSPLCNARTQDVRHLLHRAQGGRCAGDAARVSDADGGDAARSRRAAGRGFLL